MSTGWPITLVTCALLAAGASATARGATPIRMQITGDVPFTAEELEQAAGARLALSVEGGAVVVIVGPADAAGVQIRTEGRQAAVVIGAHTGLAAARVVALAIAELVAEPPDPGAAQPEPARPSPVVAAPVVAAPAAPAASFQPPPARVSVAFGTSKGLDASEPVTWTCEADVTLPLRRFDLVGAVGVWDVPTRHAGQADEASFVAGVLRATAGWRSGPVQVLLGPFVAPYRIEGGVDDTGVLAGGGVTLRAGWRLGAAPNVQVFGSFRVDAFANRVRVSVVGADPSFATPRLAAAVGIGIGWDLGS